MLAALVLAGCGTPVSELPPGDVDGGIRCAGEGRLILCPWDGGMRCLLANHPRNCGTCGTVCPDTHACVGTPGHYYCERR